jgi:hypothetical protein
VIQIKGFWELVPDSFVKTFEGGRTSLLHEFGSHILTASHFPRGTRIFSVLVTESHL